MRDNFESGPNNPQEQISAAAPPPPIPMGDAGSGPNNPQEQISATAVPVAQDDSGPNNPQEQGFVEVDVTIEVHPGTCQTATAGDNG